MDLWVYPERTTVEKRTQGKARAASRTRIRLKQFSLERIKTQAGTVSTMPEPNTETTAKGEGVEGLPGSKSVARVEGDTRNEGDPERPCRTNCEGQAGKEAQRQEAQPGAPGVGLVHSSSSRRAQSPEAGRRGQQSNAARTGNQCRKNDGARLANLPAGHSREGISQRNTTGSATCIGWLNQDVLRLCFYRLRKDAASGVDGVTFQEYERNLEANLTDLVGRLKRKAYRARLVRRKYIPKGNGKLRPLGIPVLEDKLLQMAVTQILLAIYEVDFLPCSYGYRPGISAHDAIKSPDATSCSLADTTSWWKRTSKDSLTTFSGNGWSECWSKESLMEPF